MLNSKDYIPPEVIKKTITILNSHISSVELSKYSKDEYLNTINLLEQMGNKHTL